MKPAPRHICLLTMVLFYATPVLTTLASQVANFVDDDGDRVVVSLKGSGVFSILLNDPSATGSGSVSNLVVQGTDSSSSLSIKVTRVGNGLLRVTNLRVDGPLRSINGKAVLIDGNLTIDGRQLLALTLAGLSNAVVYVNGALGKVTLGTMINSDLFVGYHPRDSGNPMNGGTFTDGASLASLRVRASKGADTPAFINSTVAASAILRAQIASVETNNAGQPFGLLADAAFRKVSIRRPKLLWDPAGATTQRFGDFQLRTGVPANNGGEFVTTADCYVDFEAGNDGDAVTVAIMNSSTKGQLWNGWVTYSDPSDQTVGPTPYLTITTNASFSMPGSVHINGTIYPGTGTRGMRATMTTDNAVRLALPGTGYQLSVGFYFRFNGSPLGWGPRDVFGLASDPDGYYQFLQIYDQASTGETTPFFHAHWSPGGTGVGNNVYFERDKWYWVTMKHVAGGDTMPVSFYDPANNYALVGVSTGAVSSGTRGCTAIQIGCIRHAAGGSQSVDYDNILISTNGVFPLLPVVGSVANRPAVPSPLRASPHF